MNDSASKSGRVIVLGGKGFVGSAIAEEAKKRGHDVIAVDIDNYDAMIGTSCDILVNANGNSKKYLANKEPFTDFNLSVLSVARSLRDFSFSKYVHLSSVDIYSNLSDPNQNTETTLIDPANVSTYGFHKHLAEQLVRHSAEKWLIMRMAGFTGKGLKKNSIYDLLKGGNLRVHPESEYQYLDTSSLASIIFDLIDKNIDNDLFNIAGDGTICLSEIARMIPGCDLSPTEDGPAKERYEINTEKIKKICSIPATKDTVNAFVSDVLKGNIELS